MVFYLTQHGKLKYVRIMNLRLLLFEECNRNCSGCCNKDWDLSALPREANFSRYDLIMLTGGEPMLYPLIVLEAIVEIRKQSSAPIIVYTAKVDDVDNTLRVLKYSDGMTVTLHDQNDVSYFDILNSNLGTNEKSLRLNIFKGIDHDDYPLWKVKDNIEWIKNCPLPKNEVFRRA